MITLDALNAATPDGFAAALDGVFEHAPWVPLAVASARPFGSVVALHAALMDVVRLADADTQRRFLRGHPALSAAAIASTLTADSAAEQAGLRLATLGADAARFAALSSAYAARHGFAFIICARRHTPGSVLRQLQRRAQADEAAERAAALDEVFFITRLRLVGRVTGPGVPRTTGRLTSEVVDTARGCPAEGMRIELWRDGVQLRDDITGRDGRTARPLIEDEPLRIGPYELRYHAGLYFAASTPDTDDPPWFDVIPVRFTIGKPEEQYHVPLLVSPWQFTTYRSGAGDR